VFLKHNSPGTLAKAIRMVAGGEIWVDQKVIQLMADGIHQRDDANVRQLLAGREQRVLQSIFEGLCNKEIASQLGVSEARPTWPCRRQPTTAISH